MRAAFQTLRRKLANEVTDFAADTGAAVGSDLIGLGARKAVTKALGATSRLAGPVGSVVGEIADYGMGRALGDTQPPGRALARAVGGLTLGTGGAALASPLGPVGSFAGGTGLGMMGQALGGQLYDAATYQRPIQPQNITPSLNLGTAMGAPGAPMANPTVGYAPPPPKAPGASDFAKRVQSRAAAMNRAGPVGPPAPPAPLAQPSVGGARLPPFASSTVRGPR